MNIRGIEVKGIKKAIGDFKTANSYGHYYTIWYDTVNHDVWCDVFVDCNSYVPYDNINDYIVLAKGGGLHREGGMEGIGDYMSNRYFETHEATPSIALVKEAVSLIILNQEIEAEEEV